ncbi:hypothetical protein ADIARSV_3796 [Arcticibacter svalbardensis MN12-7]|uniref:DinB family protein n=1 Tax=Arcticibacter svalbardensis MN12-7 TaxID=1150600 RepID=R9GNC9_9SPHI|nr:DinB family protein [Arcticibacter svalbardensis]EOR93040.1 hypothetical protein ADIARSV_3796 [Arcticibacter svalbardensis MN12-7]
MKEQYLWVQESRNALFNYCKSISAKDLLNENSSFGIGGSIRNLLVHIANTYEAWIAIRGLNKNLVFTEYDSIKTIEDMIILFDRIDDYVLEFISRYENSSLLLIRIDVKGVEKDIEPSKLIFHVMTHEFHHKGQILSISRHLGYVPVDTDIIRF